MRSYANATKGAVPFTYVYHESRPQTLSTSLVPKDKPCTIFGPQTALNNMVFNQDMFTQSTELAQSCSGDLSEYVVTKVEGSVVHFKHQLSYYERADRTKNERKGLETRIEELLRQVDLERREREAERRLFRDCEVLSRTLQGLRAELWEKVPIPDRRWLRDLNISDFYQLKRDHHKSEAATGMYRTITLSVPGLITLYEAVLQKKVDQQMIRYPFAHPTVPRQAFLDYINHNFTVPASAWSLINRIATELVVTS